MVSDAGFSTVQYQRLESGGFAGPTPNSTSKPLIAIVQILDVTIDELLPRHGPTYAQSSSQICQDVYIAKMGYEIGYKVVIWLWNR